MNDVIPFRPRTPRTETPVPLYRLSVTRAKALGTCPSPANDTRKSKHRSRAREVTAENGHSDDDGLASLLELSIRDVLAVRR